MSFEDSTFILARRDRASGRVTRSNALGDALGEWRGTAERWLFVAPHDDDVVMGAGLLLQKAVEEGVSISVLITSDGSMGYCDLSERETIGRTRTRETLESFGLLRVSEVRWLAYPDCNLAQFLGRRRAAAGDPAVVAGYTGLQNSYVHAIRSIRPTRVFLSTGSDLHPDHKVVSQELLISMFHAQGEIWPELGEPIPALPSIYELAIYCAFAGDPDIQITSDAVHFERKLESIAAYRSQRQIELLVTRMRDAGPYEYLKESDLGLYSPARYAALFR